MSEEELIKTDSASHERNASRVARDEAELKALMEQAGMTEVSEQEETEESDDEVEVTSNTVDFEEATPLKQDDANMTAEEKSFKKRYSDIRRHMQDKEQEWKVKFEKLEQQLTASSKNELVLPKTTKDIEAWAKKYPDVAGIVEAIADKKASERSADLDGRLKEIEEMRFQAKRDRAETELLQLHPDFEKIRSDDNFHNWAEEQPKWVQDALYENAEDAKSVARVIDLYKSDTGIVNKGSSRSDKMAASSIKPKRTTTPNYDESADYLRESQVAKMSIKEYEKRADAIFEAQRQGKFIYDVSKK